MSTDKVLRLDGRPRSETGVRIVAEYPGSLPGVVVEQVFADIYGRTDAEVVEHGRRLVASWNACLGIPTETLEAGEVVPLALVDSIIREVLTNEEKYVPAAMLGNQGLNAYHGIMREIRNALSRLQQNGGEAK